jgi:hypothetical protein
MKKRHEGAAYGTMDVHNKPSPATVQNGEERVVSQGRLNWV